MLSGKRAVYYICVNEGHPGQVSRIVWEILRAKNLMAETGVLFDGGEVMRHEDGKGNLFHFVPTEVPVCWNYPKYLPEMNARFADVDIAGTVTWHEGANAPSKALTVHSIGDIAGGVYGPASPRCMRNLLRALESSRLSLGLSDYLTTTEATHWSGTHVAGSAPELILRYPAPMVDIEVGSTEESWADRTACAALADALTRVFDDDGKRVRNILCIGGVHFDPAFARAALTEWGDEAFGVSHILANQWLVSGEYETPHGPAFASAAAEAVDGGIEAVAFHDKVKACYKDLARALGEKYRVPVLRHQRLRTPESIEWGELPSGGVSR